MLSTQQILQAVIDMQANAQQALPVIPNNGNPMGANNMPAARGSILPQQPTGGYDSSGIIPANAKPSPMAERFPWLRPSASMDNVRQFLNNRKGTLAQPQQPVPAPVMPLRM